MEGVLQILICVLCILIFLIAICGLALYVLKKKKNVETENDKNDSTVSPKGTINENIVNIKQFLDFDEIKDNMIIRKDRTQYIMVIQCQGVNYDLLSEEEKVAVEEGFVQFLNTLRFPIQLYVQTQTLNLEDIVGEYKEKIHNIENEIRNLQRKLEQAKAMSNIKEIEKIKFELKEKLTYWNMEQILRNM